MRPTYIAFGGSRIFDKVTAGTGNGFLLDMYPGTRIRFIFGGNSIGSITSLTMNEWTHVAATYDSNTGYAAIYINGVLDRSGTLNGAIPVNNLGMTQSTTYDVDVTNDERRYFKVITSDQPY